jgi:hypothetical protein
LSLAKRFLYIIYLLLLMSGVIDVIHSIHPTVKNNFYCAILEKWVFDWERHLRRGINCWQINDWYILGNLKFLNASSPKISLTIYTRPLVVWSIDTD